MLGTLVFMKTDFDFIVSCSDSSGDTADIVIAGRTLIILQGKEFYIEWNQFNTFYQFNHKARLSTILSRYNDQSLLL